MSQKEDKFWDLFDKVFMPLVRKNIYKLNNNKPVYYEAVIDLEDMVSSGKWREYIVNYTNLAAYSLTKYVIARDKWYGTPKYIDRLNEMIKQI